MAGTINLERRIEQIPVLLIAIAFFAFGMLISVELGTQVTCWREAQTWVERPCMLKLVQLGESGDEGRTVKAEYEYDFLGQSYQGDRVWFQTAYDNIGDFHQRTYRELSQHQHQARPFRCFVNPDRPSQCVLYRELRVEVVVFWLVLLAACGGPSLGLVVFLVNTSRKQREAAVMEALHPNEPWKWDRSAVDSVFHPKRDWIGLAIVAVIWNLFFGCLIYTQWHDPLRYFAMLFLLFGLLLDRKAYVTWRG